MMRKKGKGTVYRRGAKRARRQVRPCLRGDGDGDPRRADDPDREVKDQPHLFGILDRINGLGLELLSVQAFSEDAHSSAEVVGELKPLTGTLTTSPAGLFTRVRGRGTPRSSPVERACRCSAVAGIILFGGKGLTR